MDKDMPPSIAMIEKLLKLNGILEKFERVLQEYPLVLALPYLSIKNKPNAAAFYDRKKLLSVFQKVYAQYFTASEVLDLIAFYKTPTGMKLAQKSDAVQYDLREASIDLSISIAVEMIKKSRTNEESS